MVVSSVPALPRRSGLGGELRGRPADCEKERFLVHPFPRPPFSMQTALSSDARLFGQVTPICLSNKQLSYSISFRPLWATASGASEELGPAPAWPRRSMSGSHCEAHSPSHSVRLIAGGVMRRVPLSVCVLLKTGLNPLASGAVEWAGRLTERPCEKSLPNIPVIEPFYTKPRESFHLLSSDTQTVW